MRAQDPKVLPIVKRVAMANKVLGSWYKTTGMAKILMTFGHVSERLQGKDLFVIRGRPRIHDLLIRTVPRDVLTVDFQASKVAGSPGVSMPGETKLHSFIYKTRPSALAVCHAHPHYAVLASVLGLNLKPMCNEGIELFPVPVYKNNALISTDELAKELTDSMRGANTCLMSGHGAVTVSDSCEGAVMQMIQLEEQARLNLLAFMAKGGEYEGIPEEQARATIEGARESLRRSGIPEDQIRHHLRGFNLWEYLEKEARADF